MGFDHPAVRLEVFCSAGGGNAQCNCLTDFPIQTWGSSSFWRTFWMPSFMHFLGKQLVSIWGDSSQYFLYDRNRMEMTLNHWHRVADCVYLRFGRARSFSLRREPLNRLPVEKANMWESKQNMYGYIDMYGTGIYLSCLPHKSQPSLFSV